MFGAVILSPDRHTGALAFEICRIFDDVKMDESANIVTSDIDRTSGTSPPKTS